jgi:hypothetical protein
VPALGAVECAAEPCVERFRHPFSHCDCLDACCMASNFCNFCAGACVGGPLRVGYGIYPRDCPKRLVSQTDFPFQF